jgi:hypothetical protein
MIWVVVLLCVLGAPVALLILYMLTILTYEVTKDFVLYCTDKEKYRKCREQEIQNAIDRIIFARIII